MKKNRFLLIAAFVSFTLMSLATTELGTNDIVIPLKKAMYHVELVKALHAQIDPAEFLTGEGSTSYTAQIFVNKDMYLVKGTDSEWRAFFYGDSNLIGNTDEVHSSFSEGELVDCNGDKTKRKKRKTPLEDRR
nr:hypothetical protein [Bacteroidota bacterium]